MELGPKHEARSLVAGSEAARRYVIANLSATFCSCKSKTICSNASTRSTRPPRRECGCARMLPKSDGCCRAAVRGMNQLLAEESTTVLTVAVLWLSAPVMTKQSEFSIEKATNCIQIIDTDRSNTL
jgi:hypothetical protein